ncbi:MAG: hypothetical protein U5K28_06490 [Halobacteriales archaeon]|nr:hypothetical protein [Halobacteriales archaeon]
MSDERDALEQRVEEFGESHTSEFEPEEFDPASLGPEIPSVGTGESSGVTAGDADEIAADVDEALARDFYSAVLLANVGLFGVTLGALLASVRGQFVFGGVVLLVGISALARTYRLVQKRGEDG